MGLTRAQKMRKHGQAAGQAPSQAAAPEPARDAAPTLAQRREEMRPEPQTSSSSPMLVVGVLMAVSVLFLLYVNLLILPGFAAAEADGRGVPELRLLGFSAEWFRGFVGAMGPEAAEAYRSIHRSTALIAPLVMAAAWMVFVLVQSRDSGPGARVFRWTGLAVTVLFAAVYLLGNAALDRAVAAPQDDGLISAASLLLNLRGVLLAAMVGLLVWAMLRSVRRIAGEMAERGRLEADG